MGYLSIKWIHRVADVENVKGCLRNADSPLHSKQN